MFTDPFGLKVTVVGKRLNELIDQLRKSSPTFARIFNALDSRGAEKVNYVIQQTSAFGVRQFSGGANNQGYTSVGIGPDGQTKVAGDVLSADLIADEFIHAAGGYAKEVGSETGIPGACANHAAANALYQSTGDDTCRQTRQKINDEVDQNKKKSKDKK